MTFSLSSISYEELYKKIKDINLLRKPRQMNPDKDHLRDKSKYRIFHEEQAHMIEDCFQLKEQFEDLSRKSCWKSTPEKQDSRHDCHCR